jgi:hypothetical protein
MTVSQQSNYLFLALWVSQKWSYLRDRPWRCWEIPHCLDDRLKDGGKAVSPMHRPLSKTKTKLNSMVWVRERTIPTERQPLVG